MIYLVKALADRLHHAIWGTALVCIGAIGGYVLLHHHAPVTPGTLATAAPQRAHSELQALLQADAALAAARGSMPGYAGPAVAILHDVPGLRGFSGAQLAQILSALKPTTREMISAHLIGPKPIASPTAPPGWTAAQIAAITQADTAATETVLANPATKIKVDVTRVPIPPTRVGSFFTPIGSGFGFAVIRKGKFELDIAAIARGAHISPAIAPSYLIPGTAVAIGPMLTYDRGLHVALAATVHF